MEDNQLNSNLIERFLEKPACEFTKADVIRYITANDIKMVNFRYLAEDGKLKTLNFTFHNRSHLNNILSCGERVDGSSLFSFVEAASSDLYVVPRFRTAFLNPFSEIPAIDILCSFYTSNGYPLESAPEYILKKAHDNFHNDTGLKLKALGEIEYYVISPKISEYGAVDQKGYHASEPFVKYNDFRIKAMKIIAESGGKIKYGHSEVGNFTDETNLYEQHEIEFLPSDIESAAEQLIISRWMLRMSGYRNGLNVSFSPKITVGKAGSGMHIHLLAEKDGKNMLVENKKLSKPAKKMIAGLLFLSPALTAFGNTVPTSYFRLVPHQEAPTRVCWGDRNRSVLVRLPLGWINASDMIQKANPLETAENGDFTSKQTVELRSPDGSADIYLLLAGITVALNTGFQMPDALEYAEKLYVDVNIFNAENKNKARNLVNLPSSCTESAAILKKFRKYFEKNGIFPSGTIESVIKTLASFNDKDLRERITGDNEELKKLVEKYLHWK